MVPRNVCVVGAGYVGLTLAAMLADFGNRVICVEVDLKKLEVLSRGRPPFYEPGLEELLTKTLREGNLRFTNRLAEAVALSEVVFIAVGTPSKDDGAADLTAVWKVVEQLGQLIDHYTVVVVKSTVPVGTSDAISAAIAAALRRREQELRNKGVLAGNKGIESLFSVVSCPEFLREGKALLDLVHPQRIVIGTVDEVPVKILMDLFSPIDAPFLVVDRRSAEMIKYASNAFLATKISFINEIANLCEQLDADVKSVAKGMGLDERIGPKFLEAGVGFGGSCFPKDTQALLWMAEKAGYDFAILRSVIEVNQRQRLRVIEKLESVLGSLCGRQIALLGLAFKPGTDDIREAPSLTVAKELLTRGAVVCAYDPQAGQRFKAQMPRVNVVSNPREAIRGADALVILTEWEEFTALDLAEVRRLMRTPVIIDGRNVLDPELATALGFRYIGFGRPVPGREEV